MLLRRVTPSFARAAALTASLALALPLVPGCSDDDEQAKEKPERYEVPAVEGTAGLKGPKSFADIEGDAKRSRALFAEASKVLQHPRCVNCHPQGGSPLRGEASEPHVPPVSRGVPGMFCVSCHPSDNVEHAEVPGAPRWELAPSSMAWHGETPRRICEQIKDPERNGNRNLEQIIEFSAENELVAWGWDPGPGLEPAPGSQKLFASLLRAWVDTGAECPKAK